MKEISNFERNKYAFFLILMIGIMLGKLPELFNDGFHYTETEIASRESVACILGRAETYLWLVGERTDPTNCDYPRTEKK